MHRDGRRRCRLDVNPTLKAPAPAAAVVSKAWFGEFVRWYMKRARHPFKDYIMGHYWPWFSQQRVWVHYDHAAVINVTLGDYMQQKIFFDGVYEQIVVDWLKAMLRPTDVLWDVGANVGALSIVAASRCRRVVAFEPDPRSLSRLRANISANRLENVTIVAAALADRTGSMTLHQSGSHNTGMSSLLDERLTAGTPVAVQTLRADEYLAAHPDEQPTLLKIDVEGAEHLVLAGGASLLRSRQVRAVVFEDRSGDDGMPVNGAVISALTAAGYVIRPLGVSDQHAGDGMCNYIASLAHACH
jgi:FkbM family methyltransferase